MRKTGGKVPVAVIRRLPRYYDYLSELKQQGAVRISSSAIGKAMGLTASQIRQDLFCFGGFGQQGYGYNVEKLREEIGSILGIDRGHTAVVIGVGNLGHALMRNFRFSDNGFYVEASFDIDDNVIGTTVSNVPVFSIDMLDEYLAEHRVDIGVITVPRFSAGIVAQKLADGGVKGIWNFTGVDIELEGERNIVVENVRFADSILALSYMITEHEHDKVANNE